MRAPLIGLSIQQISWFARGSSLCYEQARLVDFTGKTSIQPVGLD